MNTKTRALLNEQIARELESGLLYLDLAARLEGKGLKGYAHWFCVQAEEEKNHASKFFHYLLDEGQEVTLGDLRMPSHETPELQDILLESLKHEEYVTELINNIYDVADNDGDYRTMRFLDWFITEQAEEEKNARDNLEAFAMAAGCSCGNACSCSLMALDREMGER